MRPELRLCRFSLVCSGAILCSLPMSLTAYAQASYKAEALGSIQMITPAGPNLNYTFSLGSGTPFIEQTGSGVAFAGAGNGYSGRRQKLTGEGFADGHSGLPPSSALSTAETENTTITLNNTANAPRNVVCRFFSEIEGNTFAANSAQRFNSSQAISSVTLTFSNLVNGIQILANPNQQIDSNPANVRDSFNDPKVSLIKLLLPANSQSTLTLSTSVSGFADTSRFTGVNVPETSTLLSFGVMLSIGGSAYWRGRRRRQGVQPPAS